MNIEQLMTAPDDVFVSLAEETVTEQSVEQAVRQQLRENTQGEDTTPETYQMLEQKYGLAPIKFTRVEEKVIRKQARKDARLETEYADAA